MGKSGTKRYFLLENIWGCGTSVLLSVMMDDQWQSVPRLCSKVFSLTTGSLAITPWLAIWILLFLQILIFSQDDIDPHILNILIILILMLNIDHLFLGRLFCWFTLESPISSQGHCWCWCVLIAPCFRSEYFRKKYVYGCVGARGGDPANLCNVIVCSLM